MPGEKGKKVEIKIQVAWNSYGDSKIRKGPGMGHGAGRRLQAPCPFFSIHADNQMNG